LRALVWFFHFEEFSTKFAEGYRVLLLAQNERDGSGRLIRMLGREMQVNVLRFVLVA
jgi:hypothetical protein